MRTLVMRGVLGLVVVTACMMPDAATAQEYKTATRLGGPGRFYGPVRTTAAVRTMMKTRRAQRGIAAVMDQAGLSSLTAQVTQILSEMPADRVSEVEFPVGGTMEWMARRRNGRPGITGKIRWGGRQPFKAFQFVIDDMVRTYTFLIAQSCGNLALVSNEPSREKAKRDAEQAERDRVVRLEKEKAEAAARAEREKAEAAAKAAAAKAEAERQEQERLAKEQAEKERQAAEAARLAAERRAAEEKAALEAQLQREKVDWFVSPLFGKERIMRLEEFGGGRCAPGIGFKGGPDFKLTPNVRFAPAIGVALNVRDFDNSSLFAEAEIRREFAKWFIGGGAGVWDFNHSDLVKPSGLVNVGVLLNRPSPAQNRLYFVTEGRWFWNELDSGDAFSSNYQFWGGIRYTFR